MKFPIVVLVLLLLGGCATSQKMTDYDMLYSRQDCLFHVNVRTIEQAKELSKEWALEECNITTDVGGGGPPKQPPKD